MISVNVNGSKFMLNLDLSKITSANISSVGIGSTIMVVFNGMIGATSTEPLSVNNWLVQSLTSSMNLIDEFKPINTSNLVYRTFIENPLVNVGLIRSSLLSNNITSLPLAESLNDCLSNAKICNSYIFAITQEQPYQTYNNSSSNLNTV
jgi:hypothetical protein